MRSTFATAEGLVVEKYRDKFEEDTKPVWHDWEHRTIPEATVRPRVGVTPQNDGILARFSRHLNRELWVEITEDHGGYACMRRALFALNVPPGTDGDSYAADVQNAVLRFDAALARAGRRSLFRRLLRLP